MENDSEFLKEFKRNMPSPKDVARMAIAKGLAGRRGGQSYIKKNFSSLVEDLQNEAYGVYLKAQKKAWAIAVRHYMELNILPETKREKIIAFLAKQIDVFDAFFLSVSQSRKNRAGSAFEDIFRELFKRMDYPFDEQQIINGKPDFLMPSRKYYDKNAPECIIFTAKRTLRERWRQIVTEGTAGLGFFLATIDEDLSESSLGEMKKNRIYVVVPASLKSKILHYKKAVNVISFEDFFEDYLDPAIRRWKKAGVI